MIVQDCEINANKLNIPEKYFSEIFFLRPLSNRLSKKIQI